MTNSTTISRLPARLDYYLELAETLGELMKQIDLSDVEVVLDLCCGWSPKVALALLRAHFKGEYRPVDRSEAALTTLERLGSSVRFPFRYTPLQKDISELDAVSSRTLVVMNHGLDDLLLFSSRRSSHVEEPYLSSDELRNAWAVIDADPSLHLESVVQLVVDAVMRVSEGEESISFLMLQYPGYQERLLGLTAAHRLSVQAMLEISKRLCAQGFAEDISVALRSPWSDGRYQYFEPNDFILLHKTKDSR